MKSRISIYVLMGLALAISGCATKAYVNQQTTPIQTKVDQVSTAQAQTARCFELIRMVTPFRVVSRQFQP